MRCGTPGGYSLNHGYAPAPVEPVIASPVSARARRKIDFDYRKPPSAATLARQPVSQRRRLVRSEEHTSELQSLMRISYAVFCLIKKNNKDKHSITVTQP